MDDYKSGTNQRQLVLNKGREKYIFRYNLGDENALLDALIEAAKDKRTSFDWFDAAILSFKLTQYLISQADELLNQGSQPEKIDLTNQLFDPKNYYRRL